MIKPYPTIFYFLLQPCFLVGSVGLGFIAFGGFNIIFTCFPTHTVSGNRKRPPYSVECSLSRACPTVAIITSQPKYSRRHAANAQPCTFRLFVFIGWRLFVYACCVVHVHAARTFSRGTSCEPPGRGFSRPPGTAGRECREPRRSTGL